MKKFKIFISSVQKELEKERRSLKEYIEKDSLLKDHFSVFLFEDSPARSKASQELYLDKVKKSDVYIGIIGDEYGVKGNDGYSPTEREFREAEKHNKEILIYVKGDSDENRSDTVKKLMSYIKNFQKGYKYKRFSDLSELRNSVYDSLIDSLRDNGIVGRSSFDAAICNGAKYTDIQRDKVGWFLRRANLKRGHLLDESLALEDLFIHLNLLHEGKLTNSAILLFGKNPKKYFPQAEIKCVKFKGIEVEKPFESYQIYEGNIFEQIDKAVTFVLDNIRMPLVQQKGTAQVKRNYEIPEFAISEAIVNAVAHRDYNSNASVQVMVFLDRIEILNPGRLPSELTIESLKKTHTSCPNNPLLANVLYLADYIQKLGSGTLEMMKQCKKEGLPEPEFEVIGNRQFKTVLARDVFTESFLKTFNLNERQIKAINYTKENGQITNNEYQKISDISKATATRELSKLVKLNILSKKGLVGKGTKYIIKSIGS